MKGIDQIEELKEGEYPQCPHGPWKCPYKQLWPNFTKWGDDYAGHIPICTLCVQWAQVKQLTLLRQAIQELRVTR